MYSVHISEQNLMHAIFTYNRSAEHKYDEAATIWTGTVHIKEKIVSLC